MQVTDSCASLRRDSSRAHSLVQRRMVALVLVCVRLGELRDGAIERRPAAEVGGNRDPVTRACMRTREGPGAQLPVHRQARRRHRLDLRAELPVPKLPYVVVARRAIEARGAQPTEEDVAVDLHQPLTLDDALTVIARRAAARIRLEHRAPGLLDLEEQRV